MDVDIFTKQMMENDSIYKNSLERIFDKYTKMEDTGVIVCLNTMTCKTPQGILRWNGDLHSTSENCKTQEMDTWKDWDHTGDLIQEAPQSPEDSKVNTHASSCEENEDLSGDGSSLYLNDGLDSTRTIQDDSMENSAKRSDTDAGSMETSIYTSRDTSLSDSSQPLFPKCEIFDIEGNSSSSTGVTFTIPEEDSEGDQSLSNNGSTLIELYPQMLTQMGNVLRRQATTEAASSVLKHYRKRNRYKYNTMAKSTVNHIRKRENSQGSSGTGLPLVERSKSSCSFSLMASSSISRSPQSNPRFLSETYVVSPKACHSRGHFLVATQNPFRKESPRQELLLSCLPSPVRGKIQTPSVMRKLPRWDSCPALPNSMPVGVGFTPGSSPAPCRTIGRIRLPSINALSPKKQFESSSLGRQQSPSSLTPTRRPPSEFVMTSPFTGVGVHLMTKPRNPLLQRRHSFSGFQQSIKKETNREFEKLFQKVVLGNDSASPNATTSRRVTEICLLNSSPCSSPRMEKRSGAFNKYHSPPMKKFRGLSDYSSSRSPSKCNLGLHCDVQQKSELRGSPTISRTGKCNPQKGFHSSPVIKLAYSSPLQKPNSAFQTSQANLQLFFQPEYSQVELSQRDGKRTFLLGVEGNSPHKSSHSLDGFSSTGSPRSFKADVTGIQYQSQPSPSTQTHRFNSPRGFMKRVSRQLTYSAQQ
ncbi:uncharacterized protein LOC136754697 [Amia ocellicauda]|uniref:uncharacterized protein LOC136754697 n=1 Tax=Amia ocellicauda TaxID=2972642 RepID=UPI00346460B6